MASAERCSLKSQQSWLRWCREILSRQEELFPFIDQVYRTDPADGDFGQFRLAGLFWVVCAFTPANFIPALSVWLVAITGTHAIEIWSMLEKHQELRYEVYSRRSGGPLPEDPNSFLAQMQTIATDCAS